MLTLLGKKNLKFFQNFIKLRHWGLEYSKGIIDYVASIFLKVCLVLHYSDMITF